MNKVFKQRFSELEAQAALVEASKEVIRSGKFGSSDEYEYVDEALLLNWKVKIKDLLSKACGVESQYFQEFVSLKGNRAYTTFKKLEAIFLAAKEDFEGGYLLSAKTLIQAEVFDSELEQANELLEAGYSTAAAVVTGVVLETALRELCDKESIPHGKLDKMNAELAKVGKYNKLVQKQITAWADVRNSAAHGKPSEFTKQDVTDMIKGVGQFLANHLSD